MPNVTVVYFGWIGGKFGERQFLESLGIKVGAYNSEVQSFDGCIVSPAALEKLKKTEWAKRVWGLVQKRELTPTKEEMDDIPF